jgi:hypothetical protein
VGVVCPNTRSCARQQPHPRSFVGVAGGSRARRTARVFARTAPASDTIPCASLRMVGFPRARPAVRIFARTAPGWRNCPGAAGSPGRWRERLLRRNSALALTSEPTLALWSWAAARVLLVLATLMFAAMALALARSPGTGPGRCCTCAKQFACRWTSRCVAAIGLGLGRLGKQLPCRRTPGMRLPLRSCSGVWADAPPPPRTIRETLAEFYQTRKPFAQRFELRAAPEDPPLLSLSLSLSLSSPHTRAAHGILLDREPLHMLGHMCAR